jgi:mannose-1-phosphate guanylyltransferase
MNAKNSKETVPGLYAVVLAGGFGERFWPLSRQARPKHHLALLSERSLLENTITRIEGLVPPEQILVLTSASQEEAIRKLIPEIPAQNILVEPDRRDTGAAMALAAAWVARLHPRATTIVLPSDHHIPDPAAFRVTLEEAVHTARALEKIVTIAIPPTFPCTAFGYLELGEKVEGASKARRLLRFHEKPELSVAAAYVAKENFRWNAGMFVWTVDALLAALAHANASLFSFAERMIASENPGALLAAEFPSLPKVSFDRAIMEKIPEAFAVEAGFEWDDLGGWPAVGDYLPLQKEGNASNVPVHSIDASGNVVFSNQPSQQVALLGVTDLIVVNTGDALLICPRSESERLRELVGKLPVSLR